ncbi:ribosomal protein L21-like protein [Schizophyllum amplum]|uniref:Large ribosomal subunit protein bL21m n=1 Tax=Schizophyllum amplum TaxID=97359 RepID=A0A550C7I0_9AGAR|nr:ribosomal protein L21-like protein [Auriculariopsis ampla]
MAALLQAVRALPRTSSSALDLIRSQPNQYIIATLGGRKHILAPRDLLTIPRMPDVQVGDVVLLDQIHELGSRDFTIRGKPTIPTSKVQVQATVVEHTKGKMESIFKKKRRKGYRKTITHKQTYTRLRIGNIEIPSPFASSGLQVAEAASPTPEATLP